MSYADTHASRRQQDWMRASSNTRPITPTRTLARGTAPPRDLPATSAWAEWSGRAAGAASPDASKRRSFNDSNGAVAPLPSCWMCGKQCASHGWSQVNSSMVHRISFYPASLFTLCSTCGKAVSLAPGTSLVDVVQRCNPTSFAKNHSHAFVSFLREYMVVLESVYLDLEESGMLEASSLSSSYGLQRPAHGLRSTTATAGAVRRDTVVLHPVAVDTLMRSIGEMLADREALTLKESHLLMAEAAALQVQADQLGVKHEVARHRTPTTSSRRPAAGSSRTSQADASGRQYHHGASPLSPEQQYVRAHPLLGAMEQPSDAQWFYDQVPRTPPAQARRAPAGADEVVVNGKRYVATGQQPQLAVPPPPSHDGVATGTTARLMEAAEEWEAKEQEFALQREDWAAERDELKRHLAAAQNEARVLRERMSLKDKESESLLLRNSQLTERLALQDSSSTLQAHMRVMATMARTASTLAAECSAEKAKYFGESALVVVRAGVATCRQMKKLKDELEQTKLHMRQQQKMIEASRRAVMSAWSEKAGIGQDAPIAGHAAAQAPPPLIDDAEETTLF